MTGTMRAVVLDAPGPPEALQIRELPIPTPTPGWVLIEVKAFGLNRSELHTRIGLAEGVTFPRVLGIEATGVVAAAPGGEFAAGQQVMTMMGGMGRTFDAALSAIGVDHVLIDDGAVAAQVRSVFPDGVDSALELVGTTTLPDTLRSVRVHGVVCFTGMLSNEWVVRDFYPIGYLPRGVRLAAYGGEAADLSAAVLREFLDAVAAGRAVVPIVRVYAFDDIVQAHADMAADRVAGKLVVRL
jgi:NADPH:quinone reductase-like Zn-dependent oxidoreductase